MPQYAIIQTGGKQYRVAEGDLITVEKLSAAKGQEVEFDHVLLVGGGPQVKIGAPAVEGARVVARCLGDRLGRKVRGLKYKPKKHYKRAWGHRQRYSQLRILRIES